ncbi:MAG: ATP-dependent DNA ligase [Thermoleophilia bacterium]|nr:ATP-dependent DNA ligase [Thermoleophilia bacterium]
MNLPVGPPLPPMLARLARELPTGDFFFEPKWDGFRCLAFRAGDEVDLRSRHDRPLARYFPEVVEALRRLPAARFALDGELVVLRRSGFDFPSLMARLHPAPTRVERLRRETPALLIAFDLLSLGDDDLRARPFAERRRLLEEVVAPDASGVFLTPLTADPSIAATWLARFAGAGIDGVVAKGRAAEYVPGSRTMVKVKPERTADCVVAGFRWLVHRALPSSLLLGLYDEARLHHVGVVSSFTGHQRERLLEVLRPLVVELAGHPWEHGFLVEGGATGRLLGAAGRWTPDMVRDWVPVAPRLVCEVAYDQLDGRRFRHPARFRRWRPDREPASCGFDQLQVAPADIGQLLAAA